MPIYLPSDIRFAMEEQGCSKEQIQEARKIALQMLRDSGDLAPLTLTILG